LIINFIIGGNKMNLMKRIFFSTLLLLGIILFTLCKCPKCPKCADVVATAAVTWDQNNKLVNVTVTNIGTLHAGPFMVYVYADENPVTAIRAQVPHNINGLDPGASFNLEVSDFTPLASSDNNYLSNVIAITVQIDPKGALTECDSSGKKNNEIRIRLPANL
jgi:hypothetical protein